MLLRLRNEFDETPADRELQHKYTQIILSDSASTAIRMNGEIRGKIGTSFLRKNLFLF
jgi:hypothetical protein